MGFANFNRDSRRRPHPTSTKTTLDQLDPWVIDGRYAADLPDLERVEVDELLAIAARVLDAIRTLIMKSVSRLDVRRISKDTLRSHARSSDRSGLLEHLVELVLLLGCQVVEQKLIKVLHRRNTGDDLGDRPRSIRRGVTS
jgi:hypothetical protein